MFIQVIPIILLLFYDYLLLFFLFFYFLESYDFSYYFSYYFSIISNVRIVFDCLSINYSKGLAPN
jgi:hypothetical protein